jgi:hypothetical protein
LVFKDATVDQLRQEQRQHEADRARLRQLREAWTSLESRSDPEAHETRARIAPAITTLEVQVSASAGRIVKLTDSVRVTVEKVMAYAVLEGEAQAARTGDRRFRRSVDPL